MHVRQKTVHVTIPLTVLGTVAIVPQVLKETHTSFMVAKVLANIFGVLVNKILPICCMKKNLFLF